MRFKFFKFRKKNKENPPSEAEEFSSLREEREAESAEVNDILKEQVYFEKENVDLKDESARIAYLERLRDTVLDAKRSCEEVKFEYGRVTSYLKDIQLIDQAQDDEKAKIYDSAKRIVELTELRKSLRHKRYQISDAQRKALDRFEDDVPRDTEKLLEYEDMQVKIHNDLRRLNGEKTFLANEKEGINRKQKSLRNITIAFTFIIVTAFIVLGLLATVVAADVTLPIIAAGAFAFLVAAIIMTESRRNRMEMIVIEKKQNRAVSITNRVKINYVNNFRALEYLTTKYHVRNATELDFVYSQYRQAKREWARQREGTIQIEENHDILINTLRSIGVRDREIWFTQAKALIDPSEMVEVRHELNQKRAKLREQLDYNTKVMTEVLNEMDRIRSKKPEYEADVERVLSEMDALK